MCLTTDDGYAWTFSSMAKILGEGLPFTDLKIITLRLTIAK
jgi:hypothetical protein